MTPPFMTLYYEQATSRCRPRGLLQSFTTKLGNDDSNALFEHLLHQRLIRLEFRHRVVYCLGLC
jgi:hypothetical protein